MTVEEAVQTLRKALIEDEELRYGYQANIAMSVMDEYFKEGNFPITQNMKMIMAEISNDAANRFLNLFCQTEVPFKTIER